MRKYLIIISSIGLSSSSQLVGNFVYSIKYFTLMSDSNNKKSFFSDLWDRRFFQFFATYLAASWGVIQFVEWGVRRYGIDGSWVDKIFLLQLLILPSVIALIYLHGRPGADKWWKLEKIAYPLNLILALGASMFLITGTSQTTSEVEITTDEGETIIREVPKMEFSKRVVLFPFENENGNKPTWKGIGSAVLLDNALEQDMRITSISPQGINESYKHYNYEVFDNIPLSTKRNISENYYSDFFVGGRFLNDEETKVEVIVYETNTGKEVANEVLQSDNIIQLTQKITDFVNGKIKLSPVEGIETLVTLPASNLITADTAAFHHYVDALITMEKDGTQASVAKVQLEKAVELDPTCAECHMILANVKLISGQETRGSMKEAMKYVENVSERQQLSLKYLNYMFSEEQDKGETLLKNWRKLYPQDKKPVDMLMAQYNRTFQVDKARALVESALEQGHKGSLFVTYANQLISTKEYGKAEEYLVKYKEAHPKQAESTTLLADIYAKQGKTEKAIETLDELSIMNTNDIKYDLKKANIYNKQNKFAEAERILNNLLFAANTAADTISIYSKQMEIYLRQGKAKSYYDERRKLKTVFLTQYPPIAFMQTEYSTSGMYQMIGAIDSIERNVRALEDLMPPLQKNLIVNLNDFIIATFAEDVVGMEDKYAKVKGILLASAGEDLIKLYDAEIAFQKEDYKKARADWEVLIDKVKNYDLISQNYFESFVKSADYDEGLKALDLRLEEDPYSPLHLLVKAKLLNKKGKKNEAKKEINKAWVVLKDADANFKYKIEAQELMDELGLS